MINVQNTTKQAWLSDRKVNTVTISFPQLSRTYGISDIDCDSFSLKESLCNADSMEFVGCIASSLKVAIYNIPNNVKGKRITVSIKAGNTETIPLFQGIVDSVEIDADSLFKTIVAYDDLYTAGQVDVAQWYANLSLPMTLGAIRASLMSYVGLTEVSGTSLPNDDVTIYRTLENPDTIQALTVIKSICQLNGACGIINREGKFEYRYVQTSIQTSYELPFHEKLKYEEFYCNAIQRVQIRDTEEDAGVVTSNSGNKYIVQANMFAYELATDVLQSIASNILAKVNGFTYHPMRSLQNGLPFIEVGDTIEYNVSSEGYGVDTFLVLSRTLSGIQFCRDTYESRGVQNQSEYISDLQAQVDVLKRTTNELKNLSSKIVDYILPANIEESDIASDSDSDIITFEFFSSSDDEKSSFYSSVNFDIETDVDTSTDTYGDCTLTVTYTLDGTDVEVQTHTFGDGSYMIMMNYLLNDMDKNNHTFNVNFALSGGSMSSLQVISAYLLAATAIDNGYYTDDYDIDEDDDFADFMEEEVEVGDYIPIDVPTGGSGNGQNFSGNQFCDDWYAAFVRPFEYAKIYDTKKQNNVAYPNPNKEDDWTNYTTTQSMLGVVEQIPIYFDDQVVENIGKHINCWFASVRLDHPSNPNRRLSLGIWGVYMPSNVQFQIRENYPTQGYAVFDTSHKQGDIFFPKAGTSYNWLRKTYINGTFTDQTFGRGVFGQFILVYNVEVFKTYLNSLSESDLDSFLSEKFFVLAECNIKKDWRKKTTSQTDWSDNDDYHEE